MAEPISMSPGSVALLLAWYGESPRVERPNVGRADLARFVLGTLSTDQNEAVLAELVESDALRTELVTVMDELEATASTPLTTQSSEIARLLKQALSEVLSAGRWIGIEAPAYAAQSLTTHLRSSGYALKEQFALSGRIVQPALARESESLRVLGRSRDALNSSFVYEIGTDGRFHARLSLRSSDPSVVQELEGREAILEYSNGIPLGKAVVVAGSCDFDVPSDDLLSAASQIGPSAFAVRFQGEAAARRPSTSLVAAIEPLSAVRLDLLGEPTIEDNHLVVSLGVPPELLSTFPTGQLELGIQLNAMPVVLGRWPLASWKNGPVTLSIPIDNCEGSAIIGSLLRAKVIL